MYLFYVIILIEYHISERLGTGFFLNEMRTRPLQQMIQRKVFYCRYEGEEYSPRHMEGSRLNWGKEGMREEEEKREKAERPTEPREPGNREDVAKMAGLRRKEKLGEAKPSSWAAEV